MNVLKNFNVSKLKALWGRFEGCLSKWFQDIL